MKMNRRNVSAFFLFLEWLFWLLESAHITPLSRGRLLPSL